MRKRKSYWTEYFFETSTNSAIEIGIGAEKGRRCHGPTHSPKYRESRLSHDFWKNWVNIPGQPSAYRITRKQYRQFAKTGEVPARLP